MMVVQSLRGASFSLWVVVGIEGGERSDGAVGHIMDTLFIYSHIKGRKPLPLPCLFMFVLFAHFLSFFTFTSSLHNAHQFFNPTHKQKKKKSR